MAGIQRYLEARDYALHHACTHKGKTLCVMLLLVRCQCTRDKQSQFVIK